LKLLRAERNVSLIARITMYLRLFDVARLVIGRNLYKSMVILPLLISRYYQMQEMRLNTSKGPCLNY
jgi:hypothetical protein